MIPELNRLFEEITGEKVQEITEFPSSGSNPEVFQIKELAFYPYWRMGSLPGRKPGFCLFVSTSA